MIPACSLVYRPNAARWASFRTGVYISCTVTRLENASQDFIILHRTHTTLTRPNTPILDLPTSTTTAGIPYNKIQILPATNFTMPSPVEYTTSRPESFDFEDPVQAMTDYSRHMHKHTKSQMEAATQAARRRSSPQSDTASFRKEGSISSQASY